MLVEPEISSSPKSNLEWDLDLQWEQFSLNAAHGNEEEPEEMPPLSQHLFPTNDDISSTISSNPPPSSMVTSTVSGPRATDIYISTKTIIAYLNTAIDLHSVFWKIPVLKYSCMSNGVVKKQMKFNSICANQLQELESHVAAVKFLHVDQNIITHIDNPSGRVPFKDVRKISIGISKKDIMSCRSKKKSAFYNCFVLILRLLYDGRFREFHVKVFNTGKLEIPGIQTEEGLQQVRAEVVRVLRPIVGDALDFVSAASETVLINSNFNCGFYVDREALYHLLKYKYNLQTIYDSCSYPGIQCKYQCAPNRRVSFMVFRTGSVLIVGKCNEETLMEIYSFLKRLLLSEYPTICQKLLSPEEIQQCLLNQQSLVKTKKTKLRRKSIITVVGEEDSCSDSDESCMSFLDPSSSSSASAACCYI